MARYSEPASGCSSVRRASASHGVWCWPPVVAACPPGRKGGARESVMKQATAINANTDGVARPPAARPGVRQPAGGENACGPPRAGAWQQPNAAYEVIARNLFRHGLARGGGLRRPGFALRPYASASLRGTPRGRCAHTEPARPSRARRAACGARPSSSLCRRLPRPK